MNLSLAVMLLCLPVIVFAGNCPSQRSELSLYYGNGMFSSLVEQRKSQTKLMQLTRGQLSDHKVRYKLAINHNENPFDQLLEVTRQKLLQDYGIILLWLAGTEEAPDWFREALSDISVQYQAFSYILDGDLQQHIRQYTQDIENCQKVLLVAHSQGNFYGNEAWRWIYRQMVDDLPLSQLKVMGLVSVATPASHVGEPLSYVGDQQQITRYLTLNNDLVINVIRSIIFDPLPGNLENSFDSSDWTNHGFIEAYAKGTPSQQVLTDHILSVAYNLETLPLQRDQLTSSALASAGYDSAASILEVEFLRSGSVYRYYEVPESVFDGLMVAESAGGYYNQAIRGQYTSRKLY